MSMTGFYGGPNGQSFEIKEIFTSKYQMDKDLSKGWTSPISVGEFVVVSYGMPNDTNYEIYRGEDLKYYNKSYNSTLWQKIYDEKTLGRNANGLQYKLISSMTGNTPKITVIDPTIALDADQNPTVEWDNTNVDHLKLQFKLPRSQNLSLDHPIGILDCDEEPEVYMDSTDINYPVIYMALPQSQVIEQATVEWLKVGEAPTVTLDTTDINRPVLKFQLPVAQSIKQGQSNVLDANQKPYFDIDFTDIDNPILNFYLPQAQVMDNPTTNIVGPSENPNVTLNNDDINHPKLEFELPRAVKFYYGSLLGERTAGTYQLTNPEFADYAIGDYYINAATGFIYIVTSKNENTCDFQYVACIQSPLPEVSAKDISPYKESEDGQFELNIPTVTRSFTNNEGTTWKLEFGLPKAPKPEVAAEFIGPEEDSGASVKIKDADSIEFDFQIPRGAKMLAIDKLSYDTIVDTNQKPGDMCIETSTGYIYKLDKTSSVWERQGTGSLQGPVGDALHIVRDYTINEAIDFKDSLANGVIYIRANYKDEEGNPLPFKSDEVFSITWISMDDGNETSYWYYYTDDEEWARVQLTSGVLSFIENTYNSEKDGPVTNKTYSIHYINQLIGGNIKIKDPDKVAFSADQIYALLSWGDFDNTEPEDWFPDENTSDDTLSVEEAIELMSWGSMDRLILESNT